MEEEKVKLDTSRYSASFRSSIGPNTLDFVPTRESSDFALELVKFFASLPLARDIMAVTKNSYKFFYAHVKLSDTSQELVIPDHFVAVEKGLATYCQRFYLVSVNSMPYDSYWFFRLGPEKVFRLSDISKLTMLIQIQNYRLAAVTSLKLQRMTDIQVKEHMVTISTQKRNQLILWDSFAASIMPKPVTQYKMKFTEDFTKYFKRYIEASMTISTLDTPFSRLTRMAWEERSQYLRYTSKQHIIDETLKIMYSAALAQFAKDKNLNEMETTEFNMTQTKDRLVLAVFEPAMKQMMRILSWEAQSGEADIVHPSPYYYLHLNMKSFLVYPMFNDPFLYDPSTLAVYLVVSRWVSRMFLSNVYQTGATDCTNLLIYGAAGSGKSTILAGLTAYTGSKRFAMGQLTNGMITMNPEVVDGAVLVCSEAVIERGMCLEQFKALADYQSAVAVNVKYDHSINISKRVSLILDTNQDPYEVYDKATPSQKNAYMGAFRKYLCVPCDSTFTENHVEVHRSKATHDRELYELSAQFFSSRPANMQNLIFALALLDCGPVHHAHPYVRKYCQQLYYALSNTIFFQVYLLAKDRLETALNQTMDCLSKFSSNRSTDVTRVMKQLARTIGAANDQFTHRVSSVVMNKVELCGKLTHIVQRSFESQFYSRLCYQNLDAVYTITPVQPEHVHGCINPAWLPDDVSEFMDKDARDIVLHAQGNHADQSNALSQSMSQLSVKHHTDVPLTEISYDDSNDQSHAGTATMLNQLDSCNVRLLIPPQNDDSIHGGIQGGISIFKSNFEDSNMIKGGQMRAPPARLNVDTYLASGGASGKTTVKRRDLKSRAKGLSPVRKIDGTMGLAQVEGYYTSSEYEHSYVSPTKRIKQRVESQDTDGVLQQLKAVIDYDNEEGDSPYDGAD